jgi:hypothetical protein
MTNMKRMRSSARRNTLGSKCIRERKPRPAEFSTEPHPCYLPPFTTEPDIIVDNFVYSDLSDYYRELTRIDSIENITDETRELFRNECIQFHKEAAIAERRAKQAAELHIQENHPWPQHWYFTQLAIRLNTVAPHLTRNQYRKLRTDYINLYDHMLAGHAIAIAFGEAMHTLPNYYAGQN